MAAELRLPCAMLIAVYVPLQQPTVTSSVTLLVESRRSADVVVGLLGVGACVAPIVCVAFGVVLRRPFGAIAYVPSSTASDADKHVCTPVSRLLLSRRHDWADRVAGSQFVRHYGAVFEEFVGGRQWFVLVDLSVEAVCGVLGALVDLPTQQGSGCASLKIAMVAVTAAYAVALALLRPSNTLQDAVLVSVNAMMGASVAVAVLLLRPDVGAKLAFVQGIAAVLTAVLPLFVVVLSGRALRWLRDLLQRGNAPLDPVVAQASSCYPNLLADDMDHVEDDVDSVVLLDVAEDSLSCVDDQDNVMAKVLLGERSAESACTSPEAGRLVGIKGSGGPVGPADRSDADVLMLEATGVGVSRFLPSELTSRSDLERLYDASDYI